MKKTVKLAVIVDKYSMSLPVMSAYLKHIRAVSKIRDVTVFVGSARRDVLLEEEEFFSVRYYESFMSLKKHLNDNFSEILIPNILSVVKIWIFARSKLNIYLWCQGALPEESYMRNKSWIRYFILSFVERLALQRLKGIIWVSEAMREHYRDKYNYSAINEIVVPCLSDLCKGDNKKTFRQPYSFVYVGGASAWQKIDKIAQAFLEIKKVYTQASLTFITFDKSAVENIVLGIVSNKYLKDIDIYSVADRDEMAKVLSEFHFGFLLRDSSVVNKVSSPIKYCEYLSCGVIPIISENVGDYSKFTKDLDVGLILERNEFNGNKDVRRLEKYKVSNRPEKAYRKLAEMYDIDKNYLLLFSRV